MASPPFDVGAFHETRTRAGVERAMTLVGAPGMPGDTNEALSATPMVPLGPVILSVALVTPPGVGDKYTVKGQEAPGCKLQL